jgi:hypothetical protein
MPTDIVEVAKVALESSTGEKVGKKKWKLFDTSIGAKKGLAYTAAALSTAAGVGGIGISLAKRYTRRAVEKERLSRTKDYIALADHGKKQVDLEYSLLEHNKENLEHFQDIAKGLATKRTYIDQLPRIINKFETEQMSASERLAEYSKIRTKASAAGVDLIDIEDIEDFSEKKFNNSIEKIKSNVSSIQAGIDKEQSDTIGEISDAQTALAASRISFETHAAKAKQNAEKMTSKSAEGRKEEKRLADIAGRGKSGMWRKAYNTIGKVASLGLSKTYKQEKRAALKIIHLLRQNPKTEAEFEKLAGELKIDPKSEIYKRALRLRKIKAFSKVADAIVEHIEDKKSSILPDVDKAQSDLAKQTTELGITIENPKDVEDAITKSRKAIAKRKGIAIMDYFKEKTTEAIVSLFENKGAPSEEVYDSFMNLFEHPEYMKNPSFETLERLVKSNMSKYTNFDTQFQTFCHDNTFVEEINTMVDKSIEDAFDLSAYEKLRQKKIIENDKSRTLMSKFNTNIDKYIEDSYKNTVSDEFKNVCDAAGYDSNNMSLRNFYESIKTNPTKSPAETKFMSAYEKQLNMASEVSRRLIYGNGLISAYAKLLNAKTVYPEFKDLTEKITLQDLQNAYKLAVKRKASNKFPRLPSNPINEFITEFQSSPAFKTETPFDSKQNIKFVGRFDLALPKDVQITDAVDAITGRNVGVKELVTQLGEITATTLADPFISISEKQKIKALKLKFGDKFGEVLAQKPQLDVLAKLKSTVYDEVIKILKTNKKQDKQKLDVAKLLAKLAYEYEKDKTSPSNAVVSKFLDEINEKFSIIRTPNSKTTTIGSNAGGNTLDELVFTKAFNETLSKSLSVGNKDVKPLNPTDLSIEDVISYMDSLRSELKKQTFVPEMGSITTSENLRDNLISELNLTEVESPFVDDFSVSATEKDAIEALLSGNPNIVQRAEITNKINKIDQRIAYLTNLKNATSDNSKIKLLEKQISDLTDFGEQYNEAHKAYILRSLEPPQGAMFASSINKEGIAKDLYYSTAFESILTESKLEYDKTKVDAMVYLFNETSNLDDITLDDLKTTYALKQIQKIIKEIDLGKLKKLLDGNDNLKFRKYLEYYINPAFLSTEKLYNYLEDSNVISINKINKFSDDLNRDNTADSTHIEELLTEITTPDEEKNYLTLMVKNSIIESRKSYMQLCKANYIALTQLNPQSLTYAADYRALFNKLDNLKKARPFLESYSLMTGFRDFLKKHQYFMEINGTPSTDYNSKLSNLNSELNDLSATYDGIIKDQTIPNDLDSKLSIIKGDINDTLRDVFTHFTPVTKGSNASNLDADSINETFKSICGMTSTMQYNQFENVSYFADTAGMLGGAYSLKSSQSKKSTKLSKHRKRPQSIRHGLASHHIKKSHHLRKSKPYMTSADKRKTMRRRK